MMNEQDYELILNDITAGESLQRFTGENFEDYKKMAFLFLNHKNKPMFEDEILKENSGCKTLKEIMSNNEDRYIQGSNRERNDKMENTWYDLWSMEVIETDDHFFDSFFALKLRQIDILEIDDYLNYHLEHSFENDRLKFLRFLNLTIRKHQEKLKPQIIETVNEWVKSAQAIPELSGTEKTDIIKGRIQREQGDKLTSLNLVQTALLIQFMQDARIILKGDNLTFTQAGKAFNILTGYSSHTIRQQLGAKGDIESPKYEDYKELHEAILLLAKFIEPKIRKK